MTTDQSAIAISTATRHYVAKLVGLGPRIAGTLCATNLIFGAIAAGSVAWSLHETKASASRVEIRYVLLDANMLPLGQANVVNALPDGAYLAFAQEWLIKLLSRPLDESVGTRYAKDIYSSTDDGLLRELSARTKARWEAAGSSAIEVQDISVNPWPGVPIADNIALLKAFWTEQVRDGLGAKPTKHTATLKVVYVPSVVPNEHGRNLARLFVQVFQPTQME